MKATGIVRRVDDLGRVVIPKEIRQSLRVREGDPLEIFTENDSVIFKKYTVSGLESDFVKQIPSVLFASNGICCSICDRFSILCGVNSGSDLPSYIEDIVKNCKSLKVFDKPVSGYVAVLPIRLYDENAGAILLHSDTVLTPEVANILNVVKNLIENYLNN